jgi:hypothetical protein
MANKILLKRGSGTPTTSDLDNYEIAYDTGANKLYIRDGSDIIPFGAIVDEDNFASDDANRSPSQQSVKAYIASELAAAGAGDITAVVAGSGLTGGATSGAATLNIGAGTGIDVAADAISVDVSDFMSNGASGRVLRATGTDAMSASTNVTIDGNHLELIDSGVMKLGNSGDLQLFHNGTNSFIENYTGALFLDNKTSDQDIYFKVNDGGSTLTALRIDSSDAGTALFNHDIKMVDSAQLILGDGLDFRLQHDGSNNYITASTSDQDIYIRVNDGGSTITAIQIDASDAGSAIFSHDVKVNDNGKLKAGDGNDFTIHHDGSHSYIDQTGTGNLYIRNTTDDKSIIIQTDDGSGGVTDYMKFKGDENLIRTFKSFRIQDSFQLQMGTGADFDMVHDGTNMTIREETGNLTIKNTANDKDIILQSDDGSGGVTDYFRLDGSESVNIFSKNIRMASNAEINLQNGGESVAFMGVSDANYRKALYSTNDDHYLTNRHTGGDLILMSNNGSAAGETERLRFVAGSGTQNAYFSNVNVGIGVTSPTEELDVNGVGKFRGNAQSSDVLELGQTTDNTYTQLYTFSTHDNAGGVANVGDHLQIKSQRWGQSISFARNGQGGAVPTLHHQNSGGTGYLDLYKSLNPTVDATNQVNVRLNVNGNSFFRGGNLGIGTDSPSVITHIKDASNDLYLRLETDKTNGNAQVQYFNDARQYNLGINNADKFSLYDNTASATRFDIATDGDFKFYGTDSNFESVGGGSATYLLLSGTATQRIEFRNTSTNANGWIGIPSWNTDAWHEYLPTSNGNELAYLYESSAHHYYRAFVVNNAGEDYDFTVRGLGNDNLIKTDAGNDRVGIGTASPTYTLDVAGDMGVDHVIYHNDDTNTYIQLTNDRIRLYAGGNLKVDTNNTYATLSGSQTFSGAKTFTGRVTISDAGADGLHLNQDTGATTNSNRLFLTGNSGSCIMQEADDLSFRSGATAGSSSGTERFKVNTSGATAVGNLNVTGNSFLQYGLVVNEGSHDADFRVESNSNTHMIQADAGNSRVGINTASPSYDFHVTGHAYASSSFLGPNGSAGTPSYRFHNDGNTGMYLAGTDTIGFSTNGTERITIEDDGDIRLKTPDDKRVYFGLNNSASFRASAAGYNLFDSSDGHFYIRNTVNGSNIYFGVNDGSTQYPVAITSTQRVGIGTTSPSAKLDVKSQINVTNSSNATMVGLKATNFGYSTSYKALQIGNTSGTYSIALGYDPSTNSSSSFTGDGREVIFRNGVEFTTPNSANNGFHNDVMVLKDGTIGIGTASPTKTLHVEGSTRLNGDVIVGPNNNNSKAFIKSRNGYSTATTPDYTWYYNDQCGIFHPAGNTIGFSASGEKLRLSSSGASFTGDMTINGHITMQSGHYITAHNESDYAKYRMYAGSSVYAIGMKSGNSYGGLNNDWAMTFTFNDDADRGFLWRDSSHGTGSGAMALTTNGKLSLAHSARIGYGETESVIPGATYRLDVNGHAYVKGPDGWDGNGDKAIVALGSGVSNEMFGCGYVYGTGLVLSTYKSSGGGHFGSSTQNGLIIADTTGAASFINDVIAYASSDERLKENVKPLDNALDKIEKINGVEFDWIDGKDEHGNSVHSNEGHDVGVIAQEIEEVLPEVVTTRDNGYKAVKYEKIVPLLIEAIKEQQEQINKLEEKLNG